MIMSTLEATHMYVGIPCTEEEYKWIKVRDLLGKYTRQQVEERLQELRAAQLTEATPPKKEPEVSSSVEATLAQRGSRYGDFTDHARVCQDLKDVMVNARINMPDLTTAKEIHTERYWRKLSPIQKQALEVIMDKIARILTGDPNYDDNWHDIQGYAKLVEDRLPKEKKES